MQESLTLLENEKKNQETLEPDNSKRYYLEDNIEGLKFNILESLENNSIVNRLKEELDYLTRKRPREINSDN